MEDYTKEQLIEMLNQANETNKELVELNEDLKNELEETKKERDTFEADYDELQTEKDNEISNLESQLEEAYQLPDGANSSLYKEAVTKFLDTITDEDLVNLCGVRGQQHKIVVQSLEKSIANVIEEKVINCIEVSQEPLSSITHAKNTLPNNLFDMF